MAAASAVALIALASIEAATPRDVTVGALVVVPLMVAARRVPTRVLAALTLLAMAGRVLDWVVDGVSETTAVMDVVACVAVAVVMRRRPAPATAPPDAQDDPRPITERPFAAPGWAALTRREREVADLAADGYTAREIADRLFISERTVESHLANAYPKLGLRSKRELVRLARRAVA